MNPWDWFLIGVFVLSTIVTLATVGKPREPITPELAAAVLFFDIILIIAVVQG